MEEIRKMLQTKEIDYNLRSHFLTKFANKTLKFREEEIIVSFDLELIPHSKRAKELINKYKKEDFLKVILNL